MNVLIEINDILRSVVKFIALSNNMTVASTASNNMLVEVLECKKLASASKASPMKSVALGKTTKSVWCAAGKVEQAFIEHYVGTRSMHHWLLSITWELHKQHFGTTWNNLVTTLGEL